MILKTRYCILEQIGKGGEGHMYLARDLELGVLWAIKELPRKKKSEAKLLRLLDHPALPKMIDYVEKEEFCYLVMEYIKGRSLSAWIQEGKVFHVQELLEIGIRITQVLEYLHGLQPPVFYGDLKPENLMYTETGEVYLVDFGSAVFAYDGVGKSRTGTHGFAAPEQYEGKIQECSDVFGFGKTMLALAARTPRKEWIKHLSFFWILLRCGFHTPSFRYMSIEQVRKKLQECYLGRKKKISAEVRGIFLFMMTSMLIFKWTAGRTPSFAYAVGDVMQICYEDAFLLGSKEKQQKILEQTGEELRKLLQKNAEKEEGRRLFLMLALNEELQGEEKGAALQYEQLLFYDRAYRIGYGEYGCFLLRAGQRNAAKKLWENYEELEKEGVLEAECSRNQKNWERAIGKQTSAKLPDKKGMGLDMGGFNLSVDTEETDGWWNQGDIWDGEVETGEKSEPEIQKPEAAVNTDSGVVENSGYAASVGTIENDTANNMENNTTNNIANSTESSAGNNENVNESAGSSTTINSGENKGNNATIGSSEATGDRKGVVMSGSTESGEAAGNSAIVGSNSATSVSGSKGSAETIVHGKKSVNSTNANSKDGKVNWENGNNKEDRNNKENRNNKESANNKENLAESQNKKPAENKIAVGEVEKNSTTADTQLPKSQTKTEEQLQREKSAITEKEEDFSAIYFSKEELSSMKPMQIQKKTLKIKNQKDEERNKQKNRELRFRIEADFPVHIWSMRIGDKECIWNYANGSVCVQIPDETIKQIELLLVYEEKRKEPTLSIN